MTDRPADTDYWRVERAIRFLEDHSDSQPPLARVAEHVGLSPYHFQRLFRRWAGLSPKRFLQVLTANRAKARLRDCASVLDATYAVGLSSPGRLHDLFVTVEAMTPGEFKKGGHGVEIRCGFHPTPFGECLAGVTERGLCSLAFVDSAERTEALAEIEARWPRARISMEPRATADLIPRIFQPDGLRRGPPLRVLLKGTNFRIKVWEALLRIPEGIAVTYGDLAGWLGYPGGARAVGRAVAQNPVAVLIPCHRVLRSTGAFAGYRWGTARKKALLALEFSRSEGHPSGDPAVKCGNRAKPPKTAPLRARP